MYELRITSRFAFPVAGLAMLICTGSPATVKRAVAAEEEVPKEIIAVQLRKQGYTCDKPKSAERDKEHSKPDEPVWILHCEDASYRVRLIPDLAAKVEKIE